MQVDDELNGRKLVSRHEPATYSTCSNLPGHKNPVHMRSDGDTQKLIDNLVLENLKQQATFSKLMRGRYAPYIQLLKDKITAIETILGITSAKRFSRNRKIDESSSPAEKEKFVSQRQLIRLETLMSKFE